MIQSIDRALDILEALGSEPRGMTVINLAGQLDLNRATCANIVRTLLARGYLIKEAQGPNYLLGPRCFGLTRRRWFLHEMVANARDQVDVVANNTGCSCLLGVIYQMRNYILYAMRHELGAPRDEEAVVVDDISAKATGRLLLAQASETQWDEFISENPQTAAAWPDYRKELSELTKAKQSICTSGELTGLAVPIYYREQVVAALGLYLPTDLCTPEKQHHCIEQLQTAARTISTTYATNDSCPAGLLIPPAVATTSTLENQH